MTAASLILLMAGGLYYNARLKAALDEAVNERNITQRNLDELVFGLQDKLGESSTARELRQSLLLTGPSRGSRISPAGPPRPSRTSAGQWRHCKLGDIFRQIGRVEDAHDQYDRSVRLAEVFLGNQHDTSRRGLPGQSLAGARPVERHRLPTEARSYLQRAVELSAYVVSMARLLVMPAADGSRRLSSLEGLRASHTTTQKRKSRSKKHASWPPAGLPMSRGIARRATCWRHALASSRI